MFDRQNKQKLEIVKKAFTDTKDKIYLFFLLLIEKILLYFSKIILTVSSFSVFATMIVIVVICLAEI